MMPRNMSVQAWLGDAYGKQYPFLREDVLQAGLIQRLDVQTSGPVVVATRRDTFQEMWRLRATGHFYKEYRALVHGALPLDMSCGTLDYALESRRGSTEVCDRNGLVARTRYQAIATFYRTVYEPKAERRYYTLLRVRILTGRMHQIRVHLRELAKRLGLPVCGIVGDYKYLPRDEVWKDWDFCPRVFLHAQVLKFPLPEKRGGLCCVTVDVPEDLAEALKALTRDEDLTSLQQGLPQDYLYFERPLSPSRRPSLPQLLGLRRSSRPCSREVEVRSRSRSPSRWRPGDFTESEDSDVGKDGGLISFAELARPRRAPSRCSSKQRWALMGNSRSPSRWRPEAGEEADGELGVQRMLRKLQSKGSRRHRSPSRWRPGDGEEDVNEVNACIEEYNLTRFAVAGGDADHSVVAGESLPVRRRRRRLRQEGMKEAFQLIRGKLPITGHVCEAAAGEPLCEVTKGFEVNTTSSVAMLQTPPKRHGELALGGRDLEPGTLGWMHTPPNPMNSVPSRFRSRLAGIVQTQPDDSDESQQDWEGLRRRAVARTAQKLLDSRRAAARATQRSLDSMDVRARAAAVTMRLCEC